MLGNNLFYWRNAKKFAHLAKKLYLRLNVVVLALTAFSVSAFSVSALETKVVLKDFYSQAELSNQVIKAYRITGENSYSYYTSKTTDQSGAAIFELDTSNEQHYIFKTNAYGAISSYSEVITSQTDYVFLIGSIKLTLFDGNADNNTPLANHRFTVQRDKGDNKFAHFATGYTNEQGQLSFDLPELTAQSSQVTYRLYAKTKQTEVTKYSEPFSQFGELAFTVGNPPLEITLVDGLSQQAISEQSIEIYKINSDNQSQWYSRAKTNSQGVAIFDLDPLEPGFNYVAKAKRWNAGFSSDNLPKSGRANFAIGTSQITLKNGADSQLPILANKEVTFYHIDSEGKKRWYSRIVSDENGLVHINLDNVSASNSYQMQAKSEVANNHYYQALTSAGTHEFVIGSQPLLVTMTDAITHTPIANTQVNVYQLNDENKWQWHSRNTSDTSGKVSFDLAQLHDNGQFRLAAKVFNNATSYSQVITQAGDFSFAIGEDHFTFSDGSVDNTPALANTTVTFYRVIEGKKHWYSRITTDESGVIKTDLENVSTDTPYVAALKSSVNGSIKYTDLITSHGSKAFTIGNSPLKVVLQDALTEQPVIDNKLEVYRVDINGHKNWAGRYQSDQQGYVFLDLEPLPADENYVLTTTYESSAFVSNPVPFNGEFIFSLGQTKITLLSGTQTNDSGKLPLVEQYIHFYRKNNDGSSTWVNKLKTNQAGVVRINLPDASDNIIYTANAKSDISDSWNTYEIKTQGVHEFIVGASPLEVTLVNAQNQQVLAEQNLYLYQLDEDGRKHYKGSSITNNGGQAIFDLAELSDGKPYILQTNVFSDFSAQSEPITNFGQYRFEIGSVSVAFTNGADENQSPIANSQVEIYRVVDEQNKWSGRATTNEQGIIRVDLAELSESTPYFFKLASPVNGSHKYTDKITATGTYQFSIGNPAVTVTLSNILSGQLYPNTSITVYRLDEDDKKQWVGRESTDENAVAVFDLEGINEGNQYIFASKIFDTGYSFSDVVSQSGSVEFTVGAVPVTLINRDTQQAISNKKIVVYEIDTDNRLRWRQQGQSSSSGQLTFDIEGLSTGRRFVLKAYDVFGENQYYYGPIITAPGEVIFTVKKGEGQALDLIDPSLTILTPTNEIANAAGFTISGVADDNSGISRVTIEVNDPLLGLHQLEANLTTDTNGSTLWSADVASQWLSSEQTVTIKVTAFDYALNDVITELSLLIKADSENPTITIISHQDQDTVNNTGFTIEGMVSDDMQVKAITATLIDPILGTTISNRNVLFNPNSGQWAMAVTNGKVSIEQSIQLQFVVTDTSDKTAELNIELVTQEVEQNPLQLVNRITFGLTPDLLAQVRRGDDILNQQITEQDLDDTELENTLSTFVIDDLASLREAQLYRMIYAKRQLREVMTWFWENHFNTNFTIHENVNFERAENNAFRQHALGNFTTLLLVSAKSPAMLYYLNNAQNNAGRANENYAREVMELHTVGVDGGYNSQDIAELARIFTGWQEQNGVFFFNEQQHDYSEKQFFGREYIGSGLSEGEEALTYLSTHPSTASYLCAKLVAYFVSEFGNVNLQSQCAAEFVAKSGDIKAILQVIFNSQAFADAQVARDNVKTPVELMLSIARNFASEVRVEETHNGLNQLGQSLFTYPVPTGYSENASDWLNSNAILQRLRIVNEIVWQNNHGIRLDVTNLLISQGVDTPEAIVAYLADIAYGGLLTELEFETFLGILNEGEAFSFDANNASVKLNRLLASMISSPTYQMQ